MVGGGITSASISALLKGQKNVQVSIWDKARGAGGRMSTSRSSNIPECQADLGAQYISVKPEFEKSHQTIYEELLKDNLISLYTNPVENEHHSEGTKHYVAKKGTASIVKHFFEKSGIKPQFNQHVNEISLTEDQKWQISTQVHQNSLIFSSQNLNFTF